MKIKKWNGQREFFIQFDLYDKRKWELKCRNESKKTQCKHMQTHTHTGWKGESETEREEEKTDE